MGRGGKEGRRGGHGRTARVMAGAKAGKATVCCIMRGRWGSKEVFWYTEGRGSIWRAERDGGTAAPVWHILPKIRATGDETPRLVLLPLAHRETLT